MGCDNAVLISKHRPHTILPAVTTTGRTLMPYTAIKANTGLTAETIVAVNTDEDANIMKVADFALKGDLFAI